MDNPIAYAFMHKDGCGGIAFFLRRMPLPFDNVTIQDIRKVDGEKPLAGENITCGTCKGTLYYITTSFIEKYEGE